MKSYTPNDFGLNDDDWCLVIEDLYQREWQVINHSRTTPKIKWEYAILVLRWSGITCLLVAFLFAIFICNPNWSAPHFRRQLSDWRTCELSGLPIPFWAGKVGKWSHFGQVSHVSQAASASRTAPPRHLVCCFLFRCHNKINRKERKKKLIPRFLVAPVPGQNTQIIGFINANMFIWIIFT